MCHSVNRCLTIDDTRLQIETVGAATKTVTETEIETETETEGEDTGTEDRPLTPPAATETGTEGDGDTDRKEATHVHGGTVCPCSRRSRWTGHPVGFDAHLCPPIQSQL